MKKTTHVITGVVPGSIAEELKIAAGDVLLAVNGEPVEDIFDYNYQMNDDYAELLIQKPDGEEWLLEVEKDCDEEMGLEFESGLMDDYRSCSNGCIFCFIDQMPPGMRKTLYFKDDDSRLSFLQGNYVTLTNMSDHDIERILHYRLSPINISFQTTNPKLRCEMLRNRFAGEALKKVDALYRGGIEMNGQIVLCKGINDGAELERSIGDLMKYLPLLQSVSVVPVGLSHYREGLYPLKPFDPDDAKAVLQTIRRWQKQAFAAYGTHFVHASDEWYLLAGEEFPPEETYDGHLQLENGVGMLPLLQSEFEQALAALPTDAGRGRCRRISAATGLLAAPVLQTLISRLTARCPQLDITLYPIRNTFFGERITVSGLLTGQDIEAQLAGQPLGDELLLPSNLLRMGEEVFLDDYTVGQLEQSLGVPIRIVEPEGEALLLALLGEAAGEHHRRRQIYEQTDSSDSGKA